MKNIEITKELLAQIDFENTVNGGMALFNIEAGRDESGYRMKINAPTLEKENVQVSVENQRFMVFTMINVLEGEGQMPYFLVNLPLAPDVDVERISARFNEGKIYLRAPFNEWGKGKRLNVDLE
jgi:HSP20 family molecular chaperone IbpA